MSVASPIQNVQSLGAAGQLGSGLQPLGGTKPDGGGGQPGGGSKRQTMSTSEADRQSPILGDAPRSYLVCAPFNVPNGKCSGGAHGDRPTQVAPADLAPGTNPAMFPLYATGGRSTKCDRMSAAVGARDLSRDGRASLSGEDSDCGTDWSSPVAGFASTSDAVGDAGNRVQLTRRDFDNEFVSLVVRQGPQSASVDPRRAMVAAKAIRRFPSISLWLRTSECNKAAAFSSTVWYGFSTYSRTACLATSCFERASRLAQARRAVASAPVRGRSMGMPRGINSDTKHGRPLRTQYGASSRSWERGATSASTAYGARVGPSWAYKGQWASAQSRSARLGVVALRKAANLGCAPASMGPDRQTGPAAARHHRPILQR